MPIPKRKEPSYYDVLTEAVNHFAEHGYTSPEELEFWMIKLRAAAERTTKSPAALEQMLRDGLAKIYQKMVEDGRIKNFHYSGGVNRFTIESIKPQLRSELERRVIASANLIKLNRSEAINKTLQRFSGWATSVPKGGAAEPEKAKVKKDIKKSLVRLPFEERRVLIDQGHKLNSALNDIVAKDGGAIAAEWHSHYRQAGYNYRPDHKARDGKIYLIRDSWASRAGLVKPEKQGYTDDVTQPAEEPFCRCAYRYIYNISSLPNDMLTKKGAAKLAEARAFIAERRKAA